MALKISSGFGKAEKCGLLFLYNSEMVLSFKGKVDISINNSIQFQMFGPLTFFSLFFMMQVSLKTTPKKG